MISDRFEGYRKTSIRIDGIPELTAALQKALTKHSPDTVRKSLKRAAMVIVNDAKMRAPSSKEPHSFTTSKGEKIKIMPGNLRKAIMILPKWRRDPAGMWVGPKVARRASKTAINAYYAHFVEYGTAAHNLGYKGKFVSGKGADHPGSKPKPYMRPAYDTKAQEAIKVAMEDLTKLIESSVR